MGAANSEIKLYNTLSRSLEVLKPIRAGHVGVYCCGPTVYNYQHIGNLRTYVFEDVLIRTLRYIGYDVNHVMNVTDVGHLVSDADEGEDKMALAAKREKKTSQAIADFYTKIFFEHCSWLNIQIPSVVCRATDHIPEMINLIQKLEKKGIAYCAGGNVYFDVSKLSDYGKLAKLDLEALKAGARIEVDKNKRNSLDFALWFTKSKFENQELQWDSPWGRGYPGWHIECSAMSMKYLGEHFDIHCGGIDHIPVHHTNEIAQSEGATGKPFVNIWMHGAFLVLDKAKMSKSTGEFLTLDLIREKGFDPITYRLLCLSAHYRKELSWSWESLEGAGNSFRKIKSAVLELRTRESATSKPHNQEVENRLKSAFIDAITNDLNCPQALAVFHDVLNESSISNDSKIALLEKFDDVLGLGVKEWQAITEVPENIREMLAKRQQARVEKNWTLSDKLRKEIEAAGYTLEDTAQGQKLKPSG